MEELRKKQTENVARFLGDPNKWDKLSHVDQACWRSEAREIMRIIEETKTLIDSSHPELPHDKVELKDCLLEEIEVNYILGDVVYGSYALEPKVRQARVKILLEAQLDSPKLQEYINKQVAGAVKAEDKRIQMAINNMIGTHIEVKDGEWSIGSAWLKRFNGWCKALSEGESE